MSVDEPRLNPQSLDGPRARLPLDHISDWEALVVDAHYSVKNLATRCGFSVRHLERFILVRYGKKLGAFISGIRMQKAYNLLKCGFTVKETALGLGYKQVSHFCRSFKKHYDANPSSVLMKYNPDRDSGSKEQQLNLEFFQPRTPRGSSGRPKRSKPSRS